ncbi:membrane dipeptidase [Ktedonosporobacter rubrisoli]|uniref:Membrane dipeptidase n=1 Tax=Ktedonosporobacter rubrisoli TaxID=2509675 RepID=A0A4P6K5F5_KTERU|nr:dipeptidase [Ktedonosporobacter rubrisoli]QBD83222.1 membrane dipeptidase [Ktedonosporobacter rubrisoli]
MSDLKAFPIFDGHNDTLLRLYLPKQNENRDFFKESQQGHLDLPRARRGGFAGGFFAIFTPDLAPERKMEANLIFTEKGYEVRPFLAIDPFHAQRFTIGVMASLFRLEAASQGQVKVVRTVSELEYCLQNNILAIVLHFEGAEAIDPKLDALEVFYQAGLRSLGIVWSRPNAFGHGVPFKFPHSPDTGPGLTAAGRELVHACNRLGIMLDLSHLNEQGFWDVARLSEMPLVVTHSAAYALCHSTRNLTDRQLGAIKDSEGLVGLNFEVSNMREDAMDDPDTPLEVMVRHIDYLVERVGIEGVGFGSDFDGGITPSRELGDVTGLPRLVNALREHGYDDAALRKLTHENWLRILRQTWRD